MGKKLEKLEKLEELKELEKLEELEEVERLEELKELEEVEEVEDNLRQSAVKNNPVILCGLCGGPPNITGKTRSLNGLF